MPRGNRFRVAIIADLHCHGADGNVKEESFLIAHAPRIPASRHPVQALIELINESSLQADALLCPGDLSNRICRAGMMQAWDHLRELNDKLSSELLLITLGNHDVDFKRVHQAPPFEVPRTLHPEFPYNDRQAQDSYWANGFFFANGSKGVEVLVLNTVVDHDDEKSAKRGTFDEHRIEKLRAALSARYGPSPRSDPANLRIALLHHHPILHSTLNFSSADVLQFGDQLLDLIRSYGYRFIIHGHRHDPRISRYVAPSGECIVFAAGSFSAVLRELSSTTRNLFHVVDFDLKQGRQLVGGVRTWEFGHGVGWRRATERSAKLPYWAGFSTPLPEISTSRVKRVCKGAPGLVLRSSAALTRIPELGRLLPDELRRLQSVLPQDGLKLSITPEGEIESIGYVAASE